MQQTVSLLLTDLVDSTAVNTRIGDEAMAAFWMAHDQGSRELARLHHGREVERSDGFLMVFEHTADAAAFALAYHRMLATLSPPLQARAGLHVGTITVHEATPEDCALGAKPFEVVGLAKAMTARLMALAGPGRTLASAEAVAVLTASGLRCAAHGFWRMRGFDAPIAVHEVGEEGSPFLPPADAEKSFRVVLRDGQWVALRDVRRRLPAEVESFHGRAQDLRRIDGLLDGGARLVVLHGPAGVGKSRLATRYAWGWLGRFPGGAYFCDLADAADAEGVLSLVARALEVPLGPTPAQRLQAAIGGLGHCLLVLDNVESVSDRVAALVRVWVDACPEAVFLVTSRASLGIAGERRHEVEPLATEDAVSLFCDRARGAAPGFDPLGTEASVLRALADLLDGLPLALELAAARAAVLPPDRLLQRLDDRFRVLAAPGARLPRQATLRAAIDSSWEALDAAQRAALAQASIFDGGFTLDAAEAVLAPDAGGDVSMLLQSLLDQSLLRRGGAGRFSMLAAVRDYAAQHLGSVDRGALQSRLWEYFARAGSDPAASASEADLGNLVLACRLAAAAGAARAAVACLRSVWTVFAASGPYRRAAELAAEVLAALSPGTDPTLRADASWVCGAALLAAGDVDAACRQTEAGLAALGDENGAPDAGARLHATMANIATARGDLSDAQAHLETARRLTAGSADLALRCRVLNLSALHLADLGRHDAALRAYGEALTAAHATGEASALAGVLGNLGGLHFAMGRLDDACEAFEQSVAFARASGDLRWEGNARCNLGLVHHECGRDALAEPQLVAAADIARRLGNRPLELATRCNLGLVQEALGDLEQACTSHRAAVDGARTLGDRRSQRQFSACCVSALARAGRFDEARRLATEASALRQDAASDPLGTGLLLCAQAELEQCAGATAEAQALLAEAAAIAAARGWGEGSELGRRVAAVSAATRGSR